MERDGERRPTFVAAFIAEPPWPLQIRRLWSQPTKPLPKALDPTGRRHPFSIYSFSLLPDDDHVMAAILDLIGDYDTRSFRPGDIVIEQGTPSGPLLVLLEGEIEILRDDVRVAVNSKPGAVFGEMSILLGTAHTARIRALKPSRFGIIENPLQFLESSAEASLQVARMLARRLDLLCSYLVDVKQQYEGHDHLGMVDEVLETLMHRQSRPPSH